MVFLARVGDITVTVSIRISSEAFTNQSVSKMLQSEVMVFATEHP